MAKAKTLTVTKENSTGRNTGFKDSTGKNLTISQTVKGIKQGEYPDYHIRNINGKETPCSNPDGNKKNNLG